MKNTIASIAHDKCTGCGACVNSCPKHAITMQPDPEGFLFPAINHELCIDCGKCIKVCPLEIDFDANRAAPECYAVWADDTTRAKSSSGGVFSLLANWVLEQKGAVIGAAYAEDCYSVHHVVVEQEQDLVKLRGSKYVQSDTGRAYTRAKEILQEGRYVLFTGTPCQIAGLYGYLGKSYANLYTLEVVCHGVPAQGVFEKFIREKENEFGSKAVMVNMRDKTVAAWDPALSIRFANGKKGTWKRNESAYLKVFLNLMDIRPGCGSCKFARLPRTADLTIADFWDIHRYDPKLDDRKGTSAVLVNNAKGQFLLEQIKARAKLCEKAPLEHAIKYNAQIKYSSVHSKKRSRFYSLLNDNHYSFEKAADYALNAKYDIGYVGWWYGLNYGSALTSFALNRVLTQMGKTVLMLDFPIVDRPVPSKKSNTHARRFARQYYDESPLTALDDYAKYNAQCDTFLVGSDQLWNWWSNRDVKTFWYFLDFVDNQHKKIAYSTSFGHEQVYYPEDLRLKVCYYLQRFDAISTREKSGVNVCRTDFDVDATHTIDPVFLCDLKHYAAAAEKSAMKPETQYVIAYILNPTEEKRNAIRLVAQELGLPYHIILDGQGNFEELRQQMDDPNVLENIGVEDWLKYMMNASYVVTDSYHGFCFSIIFSRPMSVFPNKLRGLTRFEDLANLTGLGSRFEYSYEDLVSHAPWTKPVDFDTIHRSLRDFQEFSYQWLTDALEARKKQTKSKELLLWKILEHDQRLYKLEHDGNACSNAELQAELAKARKEIQDLKKSLAPSKKAKKFEKLKIKFKNGIRCIKDHGLLYTVKLFIRKAHAKFSR